MEQSISQCVLPGRALALELSGFIVCAELMSSLSFPDERDNRLLCGIECSFDPCREIPSLKVG